MNYQSRSWIIWYLLTNFCLRVQSSSINWISLHVGEGTGFRHSIHFESFVTLCWTLKKLEINSNIATIQRFGRKWNNKWYRFYSGYGTRNNYTKMRVIQKHSQLLLSDKYNLEFRTEIWNIWCYSYKKLCVHLLDSDLSILLSSLIIVTSLCTSSEANLRWNNAII